MNKTELIAAIAEKAGLTKADAKKALDAFTSTVAEQLRAGDKVAILGFGTYSVSERKERTGVNPRNSKEKLTIPARKIAKFKPGADLDLN